ncbi:MAG: ORF6N domain-containing protein [Bacilli bacterium]|nr:ORF6N domain-containing protein [Bacilli bacterium]
MNDVIVKEKEIEKVENLIYEIRGVQVMLDSDLARLYECVNGTKTINLAVKRNIERFPEDFYFQLTKNEYDNLKFQIETSRSNSHGGVRKLPYVFTEQGVAMLASVLRTSVASSVSIDIMRAFVVMKKYVSKTLLEQTYINNLVLKDSKRIDLLEETLSKFKEKSNHLFFNGQIFDAYSKIKEIFSRAKANLIIVDAYADITILDIIKKLNVNVIVITKQNGLLTNMDIKKYNNQYHNLTIKYSNAFHDRYFIIDNNEIYHCGASINHAGARTFSINILEDKEVCDALKKKVDKIINKNKN